MSKSQTVTSTAAEPDVAAAAAKFLAPLVVGLQALAINGKQAHWNVRGSGFIAVHELLDSIVDNAKDGADEAAERIVALGLPVDGRLATIAKEAKSTAVPAGFAKVDAIIASVVSDMDEVIKELDAAIDGLADVDPASQDVAIGIKRTIEKDRWFLAAHVSV